MKSQFKVSTSFRHSYGLRENSIFARSSCFAIEAAQNCLTVGLSTAELVGRLFNVRARRSVTPFARCSSQCKTCCAGLIRYLTSVGSVAECVDDRLFGWFRPPQQATFQSHSDAVLSHFPLPSPPHSHTHTLTHSHTRANRPD
ncbi:unnamed protein product [Protopolystoma xenopodis]|uniref:Uncharacterized protein n=1 Tax=Protopolystoma xenopodis TaxID=117903 RepID=A0A3S5B2S2_9PLAT|nr:unnamed protein product [Protopolystoma xenopodis]